MSCILKNRPGGQQMDWRETYTEKEGRVEEMERNFSHVISN